MVVVLIIINIGLALAVLCCEVFNFMGNKLCDSQKKSNNKNHNLIIFC